MKHGHASAEMLPFQPADRLARNGSEPQSNDAAACHSREGTMQSATQHVAVGRLAPNGEFERGSRGPDHDAMSRRRLELVQSPRAENANFVDRQEFLDASERAFLSDIQTRSFARILAVLRQCTTARLGPFSAEGRREQQFLEWLEQAAAAAMPAGYAFVPQAAH